MTGKLRTSILSLTLAVATTCTAQPPPSGMVLVAAGTFDMGVPNGVDNALHRVAVDSFWMAQYELTVGDWRAFTDSVGGVRRWGEFWFNQKVGKGASFQIPDDWAMFALTWYEAIWYCNWRSQRDGLVPAYSYDDAEMREFIFGRGQGVRVRWNREADGYRLPTEAEWEYAARGGPGWPEGSYQRGMALSDVAWYWDNSERQVHPVGRKAANAVGLHDMLGNVGEWCWDYYQANYYLQSPSHNPTGPDRSDNGEREIRVSRGSSWMDSAEFSTESYRFKTEARNMTVTGIRLVRSIK